MSLYAAVETWTFTFLFHLCVAFDSHFWSFVFFFNSLLVLAIFRPFLDCYGFGLCRIFYKLNIKEPIPYPALHPAQPFALHTATEFTVLHCTLDNQPCDAESESGCIVQTGRPGWMMNGTLVATVTAAKSRLYAFRRTQCRLFFSNFLLKLRILYTNFLRFL